MSNVLAFDLGGTFIKYGLINEKDVILSRGKVPSPLTNLEDLLTALEGVGKEYAGQYTGVAMSMPGRIDTRQGIAHTGGSFRFISECPFGQLAGERLKAPVTIANDGKCAANAEIFDGALSQVDCGAVIVLGTGTGGGVVLDRKVWMGSTFGAGEFSILPTNFEKLHQGIHGLEDMKTLWAGSASASGLLGDYMARKGLGPEAGLDGIQFFEAYDAGEPEAAEALKDLGRNVAAGIYAIQAVLDLQRYAIGGGISARREVTDVIRESLDQLFTDIAMTPFSKPEVVTCRYGNDANLLGALYFHRARM